MCGIAGSFSFAAGARPVDPGVLARMRDEMSHRGPDGADSWISPDGRIGLAHRRLAIIDLSAAADQPMQNEDGSIRVVFNGEIYNHAEVRAELERRGGHAWRTDHSDTEVILHAYEEWGIEALHRFRGMFAIALWDGREQALWLVRDRIGVKPLYYSVLNGRLNFASEIKALLRDPEQPRQMDPESLFHYLSFLTTPAPRTLFAGIRKLSPGTWLRFGSDGSVREQRYWDAWDAVKPRTAASDDELAAEVLDELRTAVRLRKVSDVPVGVFLSGGIDSSTNAALFSEDQEGQVRTFSIGYDRDYSNYTSELAYARSMAQRVGADHHERILNVEDFLDFLPEMVRLQDEPIADPVCVPLYYVSKLARENGVVVCQVGEGADELFCGYPAWRTALRVQQMARLVPSAGHRVAGAGLKLKGSGERFSAEWLRRAARGQPVFWGGAEGFTHAQKLSLLSPDLVSGLGGLTSWEPLRPIHERFRAGAWERSDLNWMTYLDLNLRLPELLLMRVDKMSMGVSLEGRVPFLDHRLVELALGVPTAVKTRGGELKTLLKRAVKGVIPDEIIHRRKQGFGAPVHDWMLDRLGDTVRRELREFCASSGVLRPEGVEAVLQRRSSQQPWFLLNLALWWKTFGL
jgi:asparagine synthase (glutamine-hydrolysing)